MRALLLVSAIWALAMSDAAYAASELAGSTWRIEAITGATVSDPGKTRLAFDANAGMSTTVGCNQMSGASTLNGAGISFGPIAATRMACDKELTDTEDRYVAALQATRSFKIEGQLLKFLDGAGLELARFSRA